MPRPIILLTNDDGFFSEGIQALRRKVRGLGTIYIVAPDREKSATSLSLTLRRPLRVEKITKFIFAVDGTPADCVYLALRKLLPRNPDLIISGLNRGPNLGQQDISYSGTVAAAVQGTFLNVPSIAVSVLPDDAGGFHFAFAAEFTARLAQRVLQKKLPSGLTLNVNIPPPPVKGIKIAKLGEKRYNPEIIEKKDPRENIYYWIGAGNPTSVGDEKSDIQVVARGFIAITPLHNDLTHYRALRLPALKDILQGLA